VVAINGVDRTVVEVRPHLGQVVLDRGDGDTEVRSIRWLINHPDCVPVKVPCGTDNASGHQPVDKTDLNAVQLGRARRRAEQVMEAETGVEESEREAVEAAIDAGKVVQPPAGTEGRGDGLVVDIADAVGGVIVSNDNFAPLQETNPWLRTSGRVLGATVSRGVWVFSPRVPPAASRGRPRR
jgi:hypothetical protein